MVVFPINDLLYSFPNGEESTPANSKLLLNGAERGEIWIFFFVLIPFVIVTFTGKGLAAETLHLPPE